MIELVTRPVYSRTVTGSPGPDNFTVMLKELQGQAGSILFDLFTNNFVLIHHPSLYFQMLATIVKMSGLGL